MPPRVQSGFAFDRLPPELRLLLLCLRPLTGAVADAEDASSAGVSTSIDWDRFLIFARHHRVEPLAYRALANAEYAVPDRVLGELRAAANTNTLEAFRSIAETHRLCAVLERAGIQARVLKGVPLSARAYGDPGMRHVGDIDLLIAPASAEAADTLLTAEGFHRVEPAARLTPLRRRSWQRHGKDYTYAGSAAAFELDLHWRLFRNPLMPGNSLADVAPEAASFGNVTLPVLPLPRSFLFLCVHGALEGWPRLKSLIDIAALWHRFSQAERDEVMVLARSHHVVPELAAALALTADLRLLSPADAPTSLQVETGSREARWILDYACSQNLAHGFLGTQMQAGSWAMKRYELGLRRDAAYRGEVLRRVLHRPRVWERFDLPDSLFWLYPLLSPLEWALFHSRMREGRPSLKRTGAGMAAKWWRLPGKRRWLLLEALASLAVARMVLAVVPTRHIFRWLERPPEQRASTASAMEMTNVGWAVLTAARLAPQIFVCFPQALAAHAMLRRRGIPSVMHYGVRRSADGQMRAHTWLEVEGQTLLGGEVAPLYALIHSTGAGREFS